MRGDSGQPLQRALLPGMTSTDKLGESLPGAEVDGGDDSLEEVAKGEDNSNTCSQEPPARIDEQNNKERGQLQTIAAVSDMSTLLVLNMSHHLLVLVAYWSYISYILV